MLCALRFGVVCGALTGLLAVLFSGNPVEFLMALPFGLVFGFSTDMLLERRRGTDDIDQ